MASQYISQGGKKHWILKNKIAYLTLSKYSIQMYRYHSDTFNASLTGSSDDAAIRITHDKKKLTITSETQNNRKKINIQDTLIPGTTTISAEYTIPGGNERLTAQMTVNIKNIRILGLVSARDLFVKETDQLSATVETLPNKSVSWQSSDPSTVTVTSSGRIVPGKKGTATITASYRDVQDACKVTVTNTVKNLLIYRTKKIDRYDEDGNVAKDLSTKPMSMEEIMDVSGYFNRSDFYIPETTKEVSLETHKSRMKSTMKFYSRGEMDDVAVDMYKHFVSGKGTDYHNAILDKHAKEHENVKEHIKAAKENLSERLNAYEGNIKKMKFDMKTSKSNTFFNRMQEETHLVLKSIFGGLGITVNDVWGYKITVTSYTLNGKDYSGMMRFQLDDHFGLDKNDVKKFITGTDQGIRAWYILQYYKKYAGICKPFMTRISFDVKFSGRIDK